MKTLICKRIELAGPNGNDGWEDVFRQCGAVGRGDGEDRQNFQKFKYAVGRNWDNVMSAIRFSQKKLREMLDPSEEYNMFLREIEVLNLEYCQKDEKGEPVLKQMENQTNAFTFTEENRAARDAKVEELKKKYSDAIDEQSQKEIRVNIYMQYEVQIELFTVPWEYMPERLSGAYLARCAVMCTGVPDDVQEMMNQPLSLADCENDENSVDNV